jgi:hypothetical protein
VLHHTQTPNEPAAMERARLRGIRRFHREEKGWGEIAYHDFVGAEGTLYAGRDPRYAGDSGTSYDLEGRLLVCVLGDFMERLPSEQTREVLVRFVGGALARARLEARRGDDPSDGRGDGLSGHESAEVVRDGRPGGDRAGLCGSGPLGKNPASSLRIVFV